jgi:hypothetical protein
VCLYLTQKDWILLFCSSCSFHCSNTQKKRRLGGPSLMEPKVAKEIAQAQWRVCRSIKIPLILYAWDSTLQMSCFLSLISSTYSFQIIMASVYTQGYTVKGLRWTRDRPVAAISAWEHTTFTKIKHLCCRWDSNPQSQQPNGRLTTPSTTRPPESAASDICLYFYIWILLN